MIAMRCPEVKLKDLQTQPINLDSSSMIAQRKSILDHVGEDIFFI